MVRTVGAILATMVRSAASKAAVCMRTLRPGMPIQTKEANYVIVRAVHFCVAFFATALACEISVVKEVAGLL